MKIMPWIFFIYALCGLMPTVGGASESAQLKKCVDKFAPALSATLQTATVDINSSTLATDVANISRPVVRNILKSDSDCLAVANELQNYRGAQFSIEFPPNIVFDMELDFSNLNYIDKPEQLESLLP